MRNIHDHNEYHSFKNTSGGNNGGGSVYNKGPCSWIITIIIILILLSLISECAG